MTLESPDARVLTQPALADLADVPAVSRWVRSGNVRLHVLDYGPADGVPLVIVPGITSPAIAMDFVARELTDLVRPIVLDVRGRGLSDSGDAWDLDTYAGDVAAVVDGPRAGPPARARALHGRADHRRRRRPASTCAPRCSSTRR